MHWHLAAMDSHTIHYQLPNVHERSTAATPRTVDGPTFYGRFRPRHVIFDRVVIRICSPAVDQVRVEAGGSLLQTSLALNFHGLHSWRLGGWSGGRARTILAQRLCRLSLVGFQRSAGGHVSHRRREQASCCCLRAASCCSRCCSRVRGLGSSHTRDSRISVIPN